MGGCPPCGVRQRWAPLAAASLRPLATPLHRRPNPPLSPLGLLPALMPQKSKSVDPRLVVEPRSALEVLALRMVLERLFASECIRDGSEKKRNSFCQFL